MKFRLPKHKIDFLESVGFEQTYKDEPKRGYKNLLINMEKWSKYDLYGSTHLYIHFCEGEPAHCELYTSANSADCFSERNLISEMKKRGYNNE